MVGCFSLSLSSWVLYVNGKERITDCPAVNTGQWYHIGVSWRSWDGDWRIYINGKPSDGGKGLSVGTTIPGVVLSSTCSACFSTLVLKRRKCVSLGLNSGCVCRRGRGFGIRPGPGPERRGFQSCGIFCRLHQPAEHLGSCSHTAAGKCDSCVCLFQYLICFILNDLLFPFTIDQGAGQQLSKFPCHPQRECPRLAGLPCRCCGPPQSEPQQHFLCRYEKLNL